MKKRAFTLIELLITIVIIAIMMGLVSTLSNAQIVKMKDKIVKQWRVDIYNHTLLNSIWSSISGNKLELQNGKISWKNTDYSIYKSWQPVSGVLSFDNYNLWCSRWDDNWSSLQLDIVKDTNKQTIWCYQVDLATCKLYEIKCK